MSEKEKSEYNPERGSVTAYVGHIVISGSWGIEGDENYFEWNELGVTVNEHEKEVILTLGSNSNDGGALLNLLEAKALRALLDVAIQHLGEDK